MVQFTILWDFGLRPPYFTWLIPEVKKYNYGFMAMQICRLHSLAFKIIKKIKNGVFQYLASCAHGKRLEN